MVSLEARQVDLDKKSEIYVLSGIVDFGEQIVSDGPLLVLSDWVDGLPEMEKRSRSSGMPGPRARQTEEQKAEWKRLVSEYPWLAQKVAAVEKSKVARVSGGSTDAVEKDESDGCTSEDLGDAVADILDDEEVQDIFDTLTKLRADWKEQFASASLKDFETGILGGPSTFKSTSSSSREGVVADYVCCEASTAAAKSFCKSYGLQRSKRASIELYEVGPATVLTESWGHRMQYYLDLYRRSGDVAYKFTVADHDSYQEPVALTTLAESSTADAHEVAMTIRSTMPFWKLK